MPIDNALILGAGLGTRMGEIGKIIPKILWPIYFKTMLELQIRYCEDLGIKKIYLNTHFLHEKIIDFLERTHLSDRVVVLHEDVLLDSGGAIHNLARRPEVNYQGNLLLVNGDQYFFFARNFWDDALKKIDKERAVLFGICVDKNANYNETVVENNQLIEIKKRKNNESDYITYSGLGLINLRGLAPVPGISLFFETVANYKTEKIEFVTPNIFEYWDFGTAEIYAKNIFKLETEKEEKSQMRSFLTKHLAFQGEKSNYIDLQKRALDLDFLGRFNGDEIHARNVAQKIKNFSS